jgi:hypothetical protein
MAGGFRLDSRRAGADHPRRGPEAPAPSRQHRTPYLASRPAATVCRNGRPAMRGSIGWLADHTVTENEKVSPRFAKWRPFSMAASDRPATVCGSAPEPQLAAG